MKDNIKIAIITVLIVSFIFKYIEERIKKLQNQGELKNYEDE